MQRCVIIGELREMIVLRVGIAAVTVAPSKPKRFLGVPHDRLDTEALQDGEDPLGMRPERAQVAEAEERLGAAPQRVAARLLQCEVVAVDSSENRYASVQDRLLRCGRSLP